MTEERERAAAEIQATVARQITWFVPVDEKRMDPISFVAGFATMLVTAFLAGFQEEASATANEAGHSSFRWLRKLVARFVTHGPTGEAEHTAIEEESEVKKLADKALTTARTLGDEGYWLSLDRTEKGLWLQLEASLPPDRALALASAVRKAVEAHVFARLHAQ